MALCEGRPACKAYYTGAFQYAETRLATDEGAKGNHEVATS